MTAKPLWRWPAVCWVLTGIPCGMLLGVGLDSLATAQGWWTDPAGLWAGILTLVGIFIGAGIWWRLMVVSLRRENRRFTT